MELSKTLIRTVLLSSRLSPALWRPRGSDSWLGSLQLMWLCTANRKPRFGLKLPGRKRGYLQDADSLSRASLDLFAGGPVLFRAHVWPLSQLFVRTTGQATEFSDRSTPRLHLDGLW